MYRLAVAPTIFRGLSRRTDQFNQCRRYVYPLSTRADRT
jgi:hypothetical protein